ncbi:MAG TPA: hypothetical protein ENI50_01985 [Euryarchaeota archaeon]|nr:hypothetical protein [Euryarchaeota archaeon]
MFSMRVKTRVYPTESEEKVKRALKNIFDIEFKMENDYIIGESEKIENLDILKEKLKNQAIRDSARSIFLKNLVEKKLKFNLNKQAAFVGVVNFLEESKLGVIEVEIESDNVMKIVDLIAPSTLQNEHF